MAAPPPGRLRWIAAALACAALWLALALALRSRNEAWRTRLALWSDAAAKAPGSPRALLGLGHALREAGDLEGAVRTYREALAAAGSRPALAQALRRNLAAALSRAGRLAEAGEALQQGLEADPGDADLWGGLAAVRQREGRRAEAEAAAGRAVALRPGHGEGLQVLGMIRLERGEVAAGLAALEAAARADPDDPVRLVNLGAAYQGLGRRAEACGAWRSALGGRADAALRERLQQRLRSAGCP